MYQKDGRTSVSLMRTRDHVNNAYVSKDKTFLVCDRLDPSAQPVRIVDRACDDWREAAAGYGTIVQSIRMISCRGHNVWSQQNRRYSTAAIAVDRDGRVLMIHCRSPYSTHDLIEHLLQLPLDITGAMYLEGGPEAQLFVGAGGVEKEFVGSFESGLWESDLNRIAFPVPNVLGIAPVRAAPQKTSR